MLTRKLTVRHATIAGVLKNVASTTLWPTDDTSIADIDGLDGSSGKMQIIGKSAGSTKNRGVF